MVPKQIYLRNIPVLLNPYEVTEYTYTYEEFNPINIWKKSVGLFF